MLNFINQRKKFETFTRELLLVLSNSGCDQPFVTLRKTDNWRYVPTPIGHSSGGNSVKKRKNWVRVPLQSLVFCKLTDGWSHSFRQYADSVWQCIKCWLFAIRALTMIALKSYLLVEKELYYFCTIKGP